MTYFQSLSEIKKNHHFFTPGGCVRVGHPCFLEESGRMAENGSSCPYPPYLRDCFALTSYEILNFSSHSQLESSALGLPISPGGAASSSSSWSLLLDLILSFKKMSSFSLYRFLCIAEFSSKVSGLLRLVGLFLHPVFVDCYGFLESIDSTSSIPPRAPQPVFPSHL